VKIIAAHHPSFCPPSRPPQTKINRKASSEIVFAENVIARDLCPVGEGRLIESKLIIEVGNDIVAVLDHFARSFGKAWLIAIDQRQAPCAKDMKNHAAKKQQRVID
jgi:hypothetical protein